MEIMLLISNVFQRGRDNFFEYACIGMLILLLIIISRSDKNMK